MDYSYLFNNLSMGQQLKDALSSSYIDFQRLAAIQQYQIQQQQIQNQIAEQERQAAIARAQYQQAQIDRVSAELQVQVFRDRKKTSLRELQKFNDIQADIRIGTALTNASNLRQAALSEMTAAGQTAAQNAGKVRTGFSGGAIVSNTGTPLEMIRAVVDSAESKGRQGYMERFNQVQASLTEATNQKLSKAYSQFNTEQQIYFTDLMR